MPRLAVPLVLMLALAAALLAALVPAYADAEPAESGRAAAGATDSGLAAAATTPPCGSLAGTSPHIKKVVWIWFENKPYTSITPTAAPYFNQMKKACGYASNYHSVTSCSSFPEYIAAVAGSPLGQCSNKTATQVQLDKPNLFKQVETAGKSWRGLAESMPSNCYRSDSGRYAVRHAPAPYFIPTGIRCSTWDIPYSSTSPNYSANFTFVTPNLCNDMHDCSVSTGDRWLQAQLPKLLATTDYKAGNTAVFVTFDEGGGGNETLFTLVLSQYTRAGKVVSTSFNHYSLLRTTEELLKLPLLGNARYASSMRAGFGL